MLYFAYGSNLNHNEMKLRCPSAKFLGVAELQGYELEFRYYLSVKENPNSSLLVGVWDIIDDSEWDYLDYYEGYPILYTKQTVKAVLEPNRNVEGIIYIMGEDKGTYKHNERPSRKYYLRCANGYKDCKMNLNQLSDALVKAI